jgi:hypothetical protein
MVTLMVSAAIHTLPGGRPVLRLMAGVTCAILIALSCAPGKTVKRTGPAISLSADSWTFGTLKRGEKITGEITVSNAGTDTLSVRLHPTCDCLEARMDTGRLAPGESLPIYLTYLGDEIKDKTTKTLYVDSNDEARARIALEVTGKVIPGDGPHLLVTPDPFLFDPEDPRYPELPLTIFNIGKGYLEIVGIRFFGCTADWDPAALPVSLGSGGTEFVLGVRKLEGWTGTRWIEIETNDPVNPVKKVAVLEL